LAPRRYRNTAYQVDLTRTPGELSTILTGFAGYGCTAPATMCFSCVAGLELTFGAQPQATLPRTRADLVDGVYRHDQNPGHDALPFFRTDDVMTTTA